MDDKMYEEPSRLALPHQSVSRRAVLKTGLGLAVVASGAGALLSRASFTRASSPGNVVIQWNNALLQAIRDTKPAPTVVARALAVTHTCIYDAWAAYDSVAVGTQLGGTLRRPASEQTTANKNQAMSYAAYRALVDLFPVDKAMFDNLMTSLGYDPTNTSTDTTTPTGIGNIASQAVINFRHQDGSNQLGNDPNGTPGIPYADTSGYQPVNTPTTINDPSRWQPLQVPNGQGGFVIQKFATPHWRNVTPFALTSASQFRPAGPVTYYLKNDGHPDDPYVNEVNTIIGYNKSLDDNMRVKADYWADGPRSELPPGHWCLFGQFVSQRDNHTPDQDARMFFALTNAVFDAGIAAWDAKRNWDSVRPITAVHFLWKGQVLDGWGGPCQGTVHNMLGENWQPYQLLTVVTPPFAEYISGHSTFSRAAAEVLTAFTGSNWFGNSVTYPAGSTRIEPGCAPQTHVTLQWDHFQDASDEAGMSRQYGGIHFNQGDQDGRTVGMYVGQQVWAKAQTYFNGTAH